MKTQSLLLALAATPAALAHTTFTDFYVDGVAQGDGVAMRMRLDPATASFPVYDVSSNDMACNVDGDKGVSRVQSVQDGSTLTFEFRAWPNDPSKLRLDRPHKGPCAVYLKKVESAVDDPGHGDGWFKIFDDGYEASTDTWCTDKLIDNDGMFSVVLPEGLRGGYYLARPEILALHNATEGDPQFFLGCAQIFLESKGNLGPEETVGIPSPEYIKPGEDSVHFNIYNGNNSEYKIPGPPVAKLSSSSSGSSDIQTSQAEGLRPDDCIDENANWCGKEVPSYSDEKGCWASAQDCWNQSEVCYKTAPPTGNEGCKIWEAKCQGINDACNAGNFNGPPNKGEDLTPDKASVDVGLVMATAAAAEVEDSPKTSADEAKTIVPASTSAAYSPSTPQSTGGAAAPDSTSVIYELATPTSADKPKTTITVPISEGAPAPTSVACPYGYECVTSYATVVKTEVVYQTVVADPKRLGLHQRRHGHIF